MCIRDRTKTTGYQYDKVGNRLYQTVEDGTKTVSTKYTYNALGQLTQTQKGLGTADSVDVYKRQYLKKA